MFGKFLHVVPGADLYTLFYAPDRVSSLIKSMNVRASLLNDLPVIEHIYRYCLPLFPTLIESFNLRDYGLILSPRLQSEARAAPRKNISNFAS